MENNKPSAKKSKIIPGAGKCGFQLVHIKEISINEAIELFRNAGIDVNEDEAEEILQFLYTITQITIKEFFSPD